MANIFSLFGSIFIDNEKANKSIDETTEKGKKSGQSFAESAGTIVKKGVEIGTAVVGATTAVVGGLTAMINKTADAQGAIDDSAQRVGLTAEEYQKYSYVAAQSGIETSKLEAAMIKQQKAFADAHEGSASMSEAYKRLGLDIKTLASEDSFDAVIKSLASIENEVERNAIANDIFGKSYAELTPLFNQGVDGIDKLKQEVVDLGGVMSNEAVEAGATFGDTVLAIQTAWKGITNGIGSSLMPIIQELMNLILNNMPMIQTMLTQLMPILHGLLENALPPLISLAQSILPIIFNLISLLLPFFTKITEAILPIIINLLEMFLPPMLQIVEKILPLILTLIEPLLPLLQPILELLQPFIDLLLQVLQPLIELINLVLPPLIELFTTILEITLPFLKLELEGVAIVINEVLKNAFEQLSPIIENFKGILKGITEFVKGVFTRDWKKAWDGIKQIFVSIVGTFEGIFKAPINAIIDGLNKFIDWLNSIKIPDWVPGVGGKGFNFRHFDRLRHGLDYVPYDEYPALLHRGERVMTASENKKYVGKASGVTINIYEPNIYDDRGIDMLMDKVVARLRMEGAC